MVEPGVDSLVLSSGGNSYSASVVMPSAASSATVLAVVIDWHGLGSNGVEQSLLTLSDAVAEVEGFVSVHPTGLRSSGVDSTSWELDQFDIPGRDDVAYASDLIDALVENYCGDPDRIYSMGMSNGGFFTSRLVCELSDRIAAAASVAGVSHYDDCDPDRAVPFIAFHGTADKVVPFSGGESSLASKAEQLGGSDFFQQNMFDEFAQFAAGAGCDERPTAEVLGGEVIVHMFEGCVVPHTFYEIDGGGHTWPGSLLGQLLKSSLGNTTLDIDATATAWEFFASKTLGVSGS